MSENTDRDVDELIKQYQDAMREAERKQIEREQNRKVRGDGMPLGSPPPQYL